MSAYNSSDEFQKMNSTQSNGYNLFPNAYQSTGVGGKRSSKKNIKKIKMKKGGDCGCKGLLNTTRGGRSRKYSKKSSKTKTGKNKRK